MTDNTGNWESDVLKQLAKDYIKEKKRKRWWGIFFKMAFLLLTVFIIYQALTVTSDDSADKQSEHTALVDIQGPIFDMAPANADSIAQSLRLAFKNEKSKSIILKINSPGGSPVQADYIYNEIVRLRKLHPKKKVYAVCVDTCASGAYYIAAAANEIYANAASMVGSIGVLYNGFGFTGAMEKLGIDRRLLTAGKDKGMLDAFSPVNKEQEEKLKTMLDIIYEQFKQRVTEGRGSRLKQSPEIFTGAIFTGKQARELGLIDGFGSAGYVAREVIKQDRIVNYTKQNYFEKIVKHFGLAFAGEISDRIGLHAAPITVLERGA